MSIKLDELCRLSDELYGRTISYIDVDGYEDTGNVVIVFNDETALCIVGTIDVNYGIVDLSIYYPETVEDALDW